MECQNCQSEFDEMGYCMDCGASGWVQMQDHIASLKSQVKETLEKIVGKGHNKYCLFCGAKDFEAMEALEAFSKLREVE